MAATLVAAGDGTLGTYEARIGYIIMNGPLVIISSRSVAFILASTILAPLNGDPSTPAGLLLRQRVHLSSSMYLVHNRSELPASIAQLRKTWAFVRSEAGCSSCGSVF
jgi:hypothetical protein